MKFKDLKTEHNFNDNINRLVMHLARCEADSFRSTKDLCLIPKDLTVNLKVLVSRVGCHLTAIRYNARLLTPWKKSATCYGKPNKNALRKILDLIK